jgi:flagellar basal-body rod modification protein FlgD
VGTPSNTQFDEAPPHKHQKGVNLMASVATILDGKVVEGASQQSLAKANSTGMDKDSFLQLLVAQMKYQDPLQPTSNTEYISQYAQFSQVEQVQNMASTMEMQRAGTLVGQQVTLNTTDASGNSVAIHGKVDYVVYQNGKAFLSIQEQLYSLADLESVADQAYLDAYDMALAFVSALNQLPALDKIDDTYKDRIDALQRVFDSMDEYQKSFVAHEKQSLLADYVQKFEEKSDESIE